MLQHFKGGSKIRLNVSFCRVLDRFLDNLKARCSTNIRQVLVRLNPEYRIESIKPSHFFQKDAIAAANVDESPGVQRLILLKQVFDEFGARAKHLFASRLSRFLKEVRTPKLCRFRVTVIGIQLFRRGTRRDIERPALNAYYINEVEFF